jgi:hypothetical protein
VPARKLSGTYAGLSPSELRDAHTLVLAELVQAILNGADATTLRQHAALAQAIDQREHDRPACRQRIAAEGGQRADPSS